MNQFYAGQKVICIDAKFTHVSIDQKLREGEIYTVREVLPYTHYIDGEFIGLRLVEIDRGPDPGGYGADDMPFHSRRFRPVVKDQLGSLRALLVPGQPLAPSINEPKRKAPKKEVEEA